VKQSVALATTEIGEYFFLIFLGFFCATLLCFSGVFLDVFENFMP